MDIADDQSISVSVASVAEGHGIYEFVKRLLDVTIALVALALLSPLWAAIAIAIRLTSPGPALYRQQRVVGKGGREFTVYKFRTMHNNNNDEIHKRAIARFVDGQPLSPVKENGVRRVVYKLVDDPRTTPLGKILRKTGLDEVPQFINVLRGEMSIVGPRPPLCYEYEHYTDREKQRLTVLPGITGLYQVTGRSEVTFQQMVDLDLEYIARRSLRLDLWIMARTPWVMLTGKGAY